MYTTVNEDGVLNNYTTEPQVYCAEYPAIWEQRKYVLQGVFATLLVTRRRYGVVTLYLRLLKTQIFLLLLLILLF
ncbi:ssl1498 family light-harvesting-like protein [Nostoc sp. FACHB-888]|nr:ssl1498 family light-harvesting-like protein [Nostoc sp. FACHB-888]